MNKVYREKENLQGIFNDHSYCKNIEETTKILQPDITDELNPKTIDEISKLFSEKPSNNKHLKRSSDFVFDSLDVCVDNKSDSKVENSDDKKQIQAIASKRYRKKKFLEKSEQQKLLDYAVTRNEYLKEVSNFMKETLKELIEIIFEKVKYYAGEDEIQEIIESCSFNYSGEYFEELFTRQKKQKLFLNVIERTKLNHEFCMKRNQLFDSEENKFQELFLPEISQAQIDVLNTFSEAI